MTRLEHRLYNLVCGGLIAIDLYAITMIVLNEIAAHRSPVNWWAS